MARLGPFEPAPALAAGVSGGPDSLALALLANAWVRARGGSLLALVVDHRLRSESAAEAHQAARTLATRGIDSRVLPLADLPPGPALAERARAARFAALRSACADAGILHLLLGHHVADQAETVVIRALAGSGAAGLAGMASLVEAGTVRVLRPLLSVAPGELRAFLRRDGVPWVEDPSNRSATAQRARIRALRADAAGSGPATRALGRAATHAGHARAAAEAAIATWLAAHVTLDQVGYALLPAGPWPAPVLATLVRAIAGRPYLPPARAVAALAAAPRPATLAGTVLSPAGRLGPGWLLCREPAAMQPAIPARPGALWDGRFRLARHAALPEGATLGALGADCARVRRHSRLPARVLATLPAIRRNGSLFAVPHIGYPSVDNCARAPLLLDPPVAAAGPRFLPPALVQYV